MERRRFEQIDMLKGFAAIMVAIGHLAFMGDGHRLFYRWIFQYHMPAFFWAAGFCFSDRTGSGSFARFVWKKVRTLVLPDLLFRFVWTLLYAVKQGDVGGLWGLLPQNMYHYGTEWFVPSLLIGYIALFLFFRLHRRVGAPALALGGLLIVFTPFLCRQYGLIIGHHGLYLPFLPDSTLLGFVFLLIGYVCRRIPEGWLATLRAAVCGEKGSVGKRVCLWLCAALSLLGWYGYTSRTDYGVVNIAQAALGDSELLFFFFALLWIALLLAAFTALLRVPALGCARRLLQYAGRGGHSLALYLLHILFISAWEIFFQRVFGREWFYWSYSIPVRLIYAGGVIALSLCLIYAFERLKHAAKGTRPLQTTKG